MIRFYGNFVQYGWHDEVQPLNPLCVHLCVFCVCVCACVLTPAAFPISLQHPSHAAADRSTRLTGADLLTASVVVLAPVCLWGDTSESGRSWKSFGTWLNSWNVLDISELTGDQPGGDCFFWIILNFEYEELNSELFCSQFPADLIWHEQMCLSGWNLETLLTSPSYGSHTQYVLFMVAVLRVHSSLVWTVLDAQHTYISTADNSFHRRLYLRFEICLQSLTTLQAFVSESHRDTSQWRWTSS